MVTVSKWNIVCVCVIPAAALSLVNTKVATTNTLDNLEEVTAM